MFAPRFIEFWMFLSDEQLNHSRYRSSDIFTNQVQCRFAPYVVSVYCLALHGDEIWTSLQTMRCAPLNDKYASRMSQSIVFDNRFYEYILTEFPITQPIQLLFYYILMSHQLPLKLPSYLILFLNNFSFHLVLYLRAARGVWQLDWLWLHCSQGGVVHWGLSSG